MDNDNENGNERGESERETRERDPLLRRASDRPAFDLNVRRLTRAHVEAVCAEFGPDAAWLRLGISRSTLYKWRRDWRREDEALLEAEKAEERRTEGE